MPFPQFSLLFSLACKMFSYFFEAEQSLNKSWLCLNDIENDDEKCIFLAVQQFHRKNQLVPYVECFVIQLIALLAIPSNIWAIHRFKAKRHLNKEFQILISALCYYNCLSAIPCSIFAWARITQFNYPFGYFGCFLTLVFAVIVNNSTSFTLALISYERRSLILFRRAQRPSRTKSVTIGLVIIFLFCLTFWLGIFIGQDVLIFTNYQIYDSNSFSQSQICGTIPRKIGGLPPELLFGFFHFLLPFSIITYNYMLVFESSPIFLINILFSPGICGW